MTNKNFQGKAKNNLTLPITKTNFEWKHIQVLKKLNNKPTTYMITGWLAEQIDIDEFVIILQKLHLLKIAPIEIGLNFIGVAKLKNILKKSKLKVSGKKGELIERILKNLTEEDIRNFDEYQDYYTLTNEGNAMLKDFEQKQKEILESIIDTILMKDFKKAYDMICKIKNSKPNLYENINIAKELLTNQNLYSEQLDNSTNKVTTAILIYLTATGNSSAEEQKLLFEAYNIKEIDAVTKYEADIIRSKFIINNYSKELECEYYEYNATFDINTCPICGKLDGKKIKLNKAKIGVNCPPMHIGCRCDISPVYKHDTSLSSKWCRNPLTGKSETTSCKTYSEWRKQYKNIK